MPDDFPLPIDQRQARLEELLAEIESRDPQTAAAAREMLQIVLELHAAGLARMLATLPAGAGDQQDLLTQWSQDDLIAGLLLLHGLHPSDLADRVADAIESVRPMLQSHGGDVELASVVDGVVRLRMRGSCHGCPSSQATLQDTIEQAIYNRAPDVAGIEVESPSAADGAALVQISSA